jgi:hypothetical protein
MSVRSGKQWIKQLLVIYIYIYITFRRYSRFPWELSGSLVYNCNPDHVILAYSVNAAKPQQAWTQHHCPLKKK